MKKKIKNVIWSSPSLLPKKLVFIDGATRSGKSMLCPLVSSLTKTYPWQYQTILDNLLPLYKHKSIRHDVFVSMLNQHFNKSVYDLNISREINLRKNDFSSLVHNKDYNKYLRNLNIKEGNHIVDQIKKKNYQLVYQTHDMLSMINEFNKLGYNYKLLYIYRHPVDNIYSFLKRYQSRVSPKYDKIYNIDNPKLRSMMIKTSNKLVPWYTLNYEEKFLNLNFFEKVVFYYLFNIKNSINNYRKLTKNHKKKIMIIKYDNLAENVEYEIKKISNFLKVKPTNYTKKVLKLNNLPRLMGHNDKDFKLNLIKKNINKSQFNEINKLIKKYEKFNSLF